MDIDVILHSLSFNLRRIPPLCSLVVVARFEFVPYPQIIYILSFFYGSTLLHQNSLASYMIVDRK